VGGEKLIGTKNALRIRKLSVTDIAELFEVTVEVVEQVAAEMG